MKYLATTLITIFFVAYIALALLMIGTVLPFAGYQVRIVDTGSMTPTMPTGSAVFVHKATSYNSGDVITFQRANEKMPTTHRIVSNEAQSGVIYYTTKGDANDASDQLKVAESEVIGRVWLAVPYLGYVLDFVRRPIGFFLLIGVPFLAVMAEEVNKMFKASHAKKLAVNQSG
jgi:signal peptidase